MYQRLFIFICLLLLSGASLATPKPSEMSPEEAFQAGYLWLSKHKVTQAKPYLKSAADRGHAEAAISYSAVVKTNIIMQTPEEYQYALKAAELGNINGMIKVILAGDIYPDIHGRTWKDKAKELLDPKVKQGDAEAMYNYSFIEPNREIYWLKRAEQAGYALAKATLANFYSAGDSWFLIPGKREREIRRLFKEGAELGNFDAIANYSALLKKEGNEHDAYTLLEKSTATGNATAIWFTGMEYESKSSDIQDRIKAATYYKIYIDSMGQEHDKNRYKHCFEDYTKLAKGFTPAQKAQVAKAAADFLATHTVREL